MLSTLKHSSSQIGYMGWLGCGNLGDEALFKVISDLLSPASLFYYDPSPFELRLLHLLKSKKAFCRAICLGGGTLIGTRQYLPIIKDALSHNIPLFSFGTGCRHPYFWMKNTGNNLYLDQWKNAISQFKLLSVRGCLSKALLEHLGIKNVTVVGDPVLALAGNSIIECGEDRVLGVNLGQSHGLIWGSDEQSLIVSVAENLKLLSSCGWRFRLFGVWPDDQHVLRHLAELVGSRYIQSTVLYDDPYSFMADARKCCVFLGMKLHATVLAYCAFTPVVMLEYRPKCRDFMNTMGRLEYNVRTDDVTPDGLAHLVEQARSERDRLRQEQFVLCQEYKQKLRSFAALVLSQLGFS